MEVSSSDVSDVSWEHGIINGVFLEATHQECEDVTSFMLLMQDSNIIKSSAKSTKVFVDEAQMCVWKISYGKNVL